VILAVVRLHLSQAGGEFPGWETGQPLHLAHCKHGDWWDFVRDLTARRCWNHPLPDSRFVSKGKTAKGPCRLCGRPAKLTKYKPGVHTQNDLVCRRPGCPSA
jgi:hypothetical protein